MNKNCYLYIITGSSSAAGYNTCTCNSGYTTSSGSGDSLVCTCPAGIHLAR